MHAAAEGNRDPELADLVQSRVLAPRRALLRALIVDGIDTGELRSDIDLAPSSRLLVGPMLYLGIWAMCDHARRRHDRGRGGHPAQGADSRHRLVIGRRRSRPKARSEILVPGGY